MNYYKQKTEVYRQKVEEQAEFFEKLIAFSSDQYGEKLTRVQEFLMDVWTNDSEEKDREYERQAYKNDYSSQREFQQQQQQQQQIKPLSKRNQN